MMDTEHKINLLLGEIKKRDKLWHIKSEKEIGVNYEAIKAAIRDGVIPQAVEGKEFDVVIKDSLSESLVIYGNFDYHHGHLNNEGTLDYKYINLDSLLNKLEKLYTDIKRKEEEDQWLKVLYRQPPNVIGKKVYKPAGRR